MHMVYPVGMSTTFTCVHLHENLTCIVGGRKNALEYTTKVLINSLILVLFNVIT